jgi:hypothetical protein
MVLPAHFLYIKKVGTLFFGRTQGAPPTVSADFSHTNGGKRTASSAENEPRKSLNINGVQ